ncbi:MAG: tRNA (adenosine(37)-N6)-threonylcarbamoyltransferase complex ATPase subunit type 1 TsaE [Bacilli bacterium]|nr:tRNA (adenosine(37)-N6)-threonylcarbamoyltransferase complex ATPase subunit type 1 TsaE [Bacillales bacterium]MDY2575068.1 tRNA (adenosine(37)-N6)-threonylcarbamoyltransferase complex ATPase subunit type 1 TsaE [Bacilli bacterium]
MKLNFISKSVNDTKKLAMAISNNLFKGAVISLDGDLGAGKTTFTKYLAKGMGIEEEVSSPTFNILKCYFKGKLPLYHIDAYRLEERINMDIGLEEVIEGDGVCVIEWGKFIQDLVFQPLNIKITIIDSNTREFEISSDYQKYDSLMNNLKESLHA